MSWATAKAEIKTVLEGVAGVKRVYENPPNTMKDWPAFVIYPPALEVERRPSGWRVKNYTVRMQCITSDQDWANAAGVIDTLREGTIDAFDGAIRLEDQCTVIMGPRCEAAGLVQWGDRPFIGFDALITVRIDDEVTYIS